MATAMRTGRRGLFARLIRWVFRIVLALLILFALALALYRFVPVLDSLLAPN